MIKRRSAACGDRRLLVLLLLIPALLLPSLAASARQGGPAPALAGLRIRVTGEAAVQGASGVLTFPRQGRSAVLAVEALDASGRPVTEADLAPTWSTGDPEVVSIHGAADGPSVRVVAQAEGRAVVSVTARGKSASILVYVGGARERITAAEVTPPFRVARLELGWEPVALDDPDAVMRGRALLLGENGHAVVLRARALAADGTPIPLEDFPVTWATADASVAELIQTGEAQTHVVGRGPGRTRVTATIQGVTLAVETFVGDKRQTADAVLFGQGAAVTSSASQGEPPHVTAGQSPRPVNVAQRATGGTQVATINRPPAVLTSGRSTTQPGPAPADVVATVAGVGAVSLRWTAPPGASSYVIASAPGAAGPFAEVASVQASASSHTVKGLRPGPVHFTVAANYPDRPAGESGPVSVTMPQAPQPKNFRASSGPGYVLLQWDPVPEAAGYTLSRQDQGKVASLDDHFPKRGTPLLKNSSFIDTEAPAGRASGYVLSAVYKDAEGREYVGDPASQPRTPATPLPPETDTSDTIQVTGLEYQYGTLSFNYHAWRGNWLGWVSAVRLEELRPTGWKQVGGKVFNPMSSYASDRVPWDGTVSGVMSLDPNVGIACDYTRVYRLRVEWTVGGASPSSPRQPSATRVSRPHSVTYERPSSSCH